MVKIFDFKTRKAKVAPDIDEGLEPRKKSSHRKRAGKIDKETYLLWMFSKDVDNLVSRYVLEHRISAKEIAAVLAHRLGQLIGSTVEKEHQQLEEFCKKVMSRTANGGQGEKTDSSSDGDRGAS